MPHCTKPGCDCGGAELPRSSHPYTAVPVAMKPPGQREPAWSCRCARPDGRPLLRKYQHTEPAQCLSADDVAAWRGAHPEATCGERAARALCWLSREFGGWS